MKKIIPEKIEYYCDICGKKLVDYVSYEDTARLKIKPACERKSMLSFFRKEMIDINECGISYHYKELLVCGDCYDKMIEFVKENINR